MPVCKPPSTRRSWISPDWLIDSTDLTLEEVYATHFEPIVEQQDQRATRRSERQRDWDVPG